MQNTDVFNNIEKKRYNANKQVEKKAKRDKHVINLG